MQNLPGLRRCKLGTCELCGGFFHQGGVTGFVKNRAGDGGMRSRHVSICDECLKQSGDAEVDEKKSGDELLKDCLAPLKGFVKLEQVQLDGSEIKPGTIKPTEMSAEGKEFWENLKQGIVKGSIVEGKESKTLSGVRLDGGEIKPGSIKPEDWLKIDEDGDFCLKGPIKIDTLDVQPVKPHFEGYDELAAKVEQLKLLRDIEKEVRLNAEVIERRFDEDPLLRAVYIPSAKRMVKMTGKAVDDLIGGLL